MSVHTRFSDIHKQPNASAKYPYVQSSATPWSTRRYMHVAANKCRY